MACSVVIAGSPMLNAFQAGSGLCGGNLSMFVTAATFLPCFLLGLWLLLALYQRWSRDKGNDLEYMLTGSLGFAFISLAGVFFLG
ncbi:MAG: DUF3262 family protein [Steroidobacteraceae bacterium]